jgi:hypothetical protein
MEVPMVSLMSLLLPILLSAVLVFVASSIIHMVLQLHRNDIRRVPKEDELLEALRRLDIPPGDYAAPHAGSPDAMKDPAFLEKMQKGPLVMMSLSPGQAMSLARPLTQWFLYCVVVCIFAGYLTSRALGPGAPYLEVFRFAGTTAFMGFSLAVAQHSIWYRRSWVTTFKVMFDGLIYGLLTGGTFGWLWPR